MKIALKDQNEFLKLLMMNGFTIRGFAKKSGVSHPHLVQIHKGIRNPGPKTAKKITDAIGKPFEEIFFIDDGCKSAQTA